MKNSTDSGKMQSLGFSEELKDYFIDIIIEFDDFISLLESKNLDDLVNNDIGFALNKRPGKKLAEVIEKIVGALRLSNKENIEIKEMKDMNILLDYLKEKWPGDKFWDQVISLVEKISEPYNEASFLRECTDDSIKSFFREIIENQIIILHKTDYVLEQLNNQFTEEQLEIGIKIIEYSISLIIEERYSVNLFVNSISDSFGLNERLAELLWDMLNRNKADLINRYIISEIAELKKSVNSIQHLINKTNKNS